MFRQAVHVPRVGGRKVGCNIAKGLALPDRFCYRFVMKKLSAKGQEKRRQEILASCERTRQQCNRLNEEERRQLRAEALAIIYGHDAKIPARSH